MSEMADRILDAAQHRVQSEGFHGFSFRDVARDVGIKSASIHYHFPSKSDLSAVLARRYTERLLERLGPADAGPTAAAGLLRYVAAFRATLAQDGRMCLVGMLAAEIDTLPKQVRDEVVRFVDANVAWIECALGPDRSQAAARRAAAIFAALEGAMLIARGTGDVARFDDLVRSYIEVGLIPG